jgi:hypothetical protein
MKMHNHIGSIAPTLPDWQPPIETGSVTDLRGFVGFVIESPATGYANIGIVYGPSGIGKTTGVLACLQQRSVQAHTGLSAILPVGLEPDVPEIGFLDQILEPLGVKPRGRTKSDRLKQVRREILANDIQLIVFDDSENFNRRTFSTVTYLRDHTNCPMVLVALPEIFRIVRLDEKLDSRTVCEHRFLPLDEEEAINKFFPGLMFHCWSFNCEDPHDQEIGRFIWNEVKPSLRRARAKVQAASMIADRAHAPKVHMSHVRQAFMLTRNQTKQQVADGEEDVDPRHGSYEEQSEERHAARHGRGGA